MDNSVKIFPLQDKHECIILESPAGLYNGVQLAGIAKICDELGLVSKVVEDQRISLYISPDDRPIIEAQLGAAGLEIIPYKSGLTTVKSCLGAACPSSQQDALTAALDITALLSELSQDKYLSIAINGCAQCCVPCHTSDLSIIGGQNGYKVAIGGKNSQFPEMASFVAEGIPSDELPQYIKKVTDTFLLNSQPDESMHDLVERIGVTPFAQQLSPYSQDAVDTADDPFSDLEPQSLEGELSMNELESNIDDDLANLDDLETDLEFGNTENDLVEPETKLEKESFESLDDLAEAFAEESNLDSETEKTATGELEMRADDLELANLEDEIPIDLETADSEHKNFNPMDIEVNRNNLSEALLSEHDLDLSSFDELNIHDSAEPLDINNSLQSSAEKDFLREPALSDDPFDSSILDKIPEDDFLAEDLESIEEELQNFQGEIEVDNKLETAVDEVSSRHDQELSQEDMELAIGASIDELAGEELLDEDENSEDRTTALEALEDGEPNLEESSEDLDLTSLGDDDSSEHPAIAQVAGIKIHGQQLCIDFGSGAQVSVRFDKNLRRQGDKRSFTFEDVTISIELVDQGVRAEVDGLEFFVPKIKRAA